MITAQPDVLMHPGACDYCATAVPPGVVLSLSGYTLVSTSPCPAHPTEHNHTLRLDGPWVACQECYMPLGIHNVPDAAKNNIGCSLGAVRILAYHRAQAIKQAGEERGAIIAKNLSLLLDLTGVPGEECIVE